MASKKRIGRQQVDTGSSSQLLVDNDTRIVLEAQQKPARIQPMRGSGLQANTRDEVLANHTFGDTSKAEQQPTMEEHLCTQLLIDGHVQSFVDFFHLMHRNDQHKGGGCSSKSQQDINGAMAESGSFSVAEMKFLRDQLVLIELSKRRDEYLDVMAAYDSLATYFMERQDNATMIFFNEKCLEIARHTNDQTREMQILLQIGIGYHVMNKLDQARQYLELCVAIAKTYTNDKELCVEAYTHLGKVYGDMALRSEREEEFVAAIDLYRLCLDCAITSYNVEAQTHSQFKIGICYNALNEPADGLPFLEQYLSAARQSGNFDGECNACAALATAHDKLGNQQQSIEFLNQYLAIATRAENLTSQADACARLGQIYTASQNFQRACEMHEKNYELSKVVAARSGNQTTQNISRVSVGAARANAKLSMLLAYVTDDFQGLLTWKNTQAKSITE
ncbi:putative tetratricopeptide-like helical domain superfamily [Plasmopara halstedii]